MQKDQYLSDSHDVSSINGILFANANPLAKEVPTSKEPSNPGPRVNATALTSDFEIPAFLIAC